MATKTVPCPHCGAPLIAPVAADARCPACGGLAGLDAPYNVDEGATINGLVNLAKLLEREPAADKLAAEPATTDSKPTTEPTKRPWWKLWE